ncbi:MAG: hypothetical protein ACKVS9_14900 [Phycisphaerae bacterium]
MPARIATLLIVAAFAAVAFAQGDPPTTQPAPELPKASDVLDGYIEATGGKAAWQRVRTRHSIGTFDMAAMGVKGKIETWAQTPSKVATRVEMGALGTKETGCDGKAAWEIVNLGEIGELLGEGDGKGKKVRLLEGAELAYALREATFNADLRWREMTKEAETIGEETIDGKETYKVRVVTKDGATMVMWYDKPSRLLVRVDTKARTEMGEVDVPVYPSDYRKVCGVLIAHKTTTRMMGMEQTAVFEKIEINKPVDAKRFVKPREVK